MSLPTPLEDQLRSRLDRATHEVPGLGDLDDAVTRGRRRRAVRAAATVTSAVAGVAVVATGVTLALGAGQRPVPRAAVPAAAPAAPAAATSDHVPGSDVDETMAAVVADHVARAGTATSVYPSDWTRSNPLPVARFASATEWQAHYRVGSGEDLTVLMSQRPTDAPAGAPVCDDSGRVVDGRGARIRLGDIGPGGSVVVVPGGAAQGESPCVARTLPGGVLVLVHGGARTTATFWRTSDATVVTVSSTLTTTAAGDRQVTDAELEGVATDPRLAFAHTSDPPAWPAANGPGWPAGL